MTERTKNNHSYIAKTLGQDASLFLAYFVNELSYNQDHNSSECLNMEKHILLLRKPIRVPLYPFLSPSGLAGLLTFLAVYQKMVEDPNLNMSTLFPFSDRVG